MTVNEKETCDVYVPLHDQEEEILEFVLGPPMSDRESKNDKEN